MFLGASIGLGVGGAFVCLGAAFGTLVVGSATVALPILCTTGAKAFAVGALAFNYLAMVVAPFFGIEMEPIEYAK